MAAFAVIWGQKAQETSAVTLPDEYIKGKKITGSAPSFTKQGPRFRGTLDLWEENLHTPDSLVASASRNESAQLLNTAVASRGRDQTRSSSGNRGAGRKVGERIFKKDFEGGTLNGAEAREKNKDQACRSCICPRPAGETKQVSGFAPSHPRCPTSPQGRRDEAKQSQTGTPETGMEAKLSRPAVCSNDRKLFRECVPPGAGVSSHSLIKITPTKACSEARSPRMTSWIPVEWPTRKSFFYPSDCRRKALEWVKGDDIRSLTCDDKDAHRTIP
nr:uncharacterized protein LOC107400947 [Peromyscus maniculatus bairdii]